MVPYEIVALCDPESYKKMNSIEVSNESGCGSTDLAPQPLDQASDS